VEEAKGLEIRALKGEGERKVRWRRRRRRWRWRGSRRALTVALPSVGAPGASVIFSDGAGSWEEGARREPAGGGVGGCGT